MIEGFERQLPNYPIDNPPSWNLKRETQKTINSATRIESGMVDPMGSFPPGGFDDELSRRMYGARTVVASGELDDALAGRITRELLALAAESDDDVRVLCSLQGDRLEPAFSLYDVVTSLTPRVQMIGTGRVAGTGVVVFCAADYEHRTCLPMARFHLHDVRAEVRGNTADLEGEAGAAVQQFERARDLIAQATDVPPERVEEDLRRGLWLDAREAETYGLVSRLTRRGEL